MTPADKAKAKKLFAMLQSSSENEVLAATRRSNSPKQYKRFKRAPRRLRTGGFPCGS
jgi:hypothetical protein